MLRMNREKNTITTAVKKNCANYNTGFKCSGVMIDSKLNQWLDTDLSGKECLIKRGEKCQYFSNVVEPSMIGKK